MVGQVKMVIQSIANRFGYQIRRQDAGVNLVDPYTEQRRILEPDVRTIFEVGAYDGRDCVRYVELFPSAKVYAFEPVPESFALLRQKAAIEPRILAVNAALADAPGSADFHLSNWVDASSLLRPKATGSSFDAYQASSRSIKVVVNTVRNLSARAGRAHRAAKDGRPGCGAKDSGWCAADARAQCNRYGVHGGALPRELRRRGALRPSHGVTGRLWLPIPRLLWPQPQPPRANVLGRCLVRPYTYCLLSRP